MFPSSNVAYHIYLYYLLVDIFSTLISLHNYCVSQAIQIILHLVLRFRNMMAALLPALPLHPPSSQVLPPPRHQLQAVMS